MDKVILVFGGVSLLALLIFGIGVLLEFHARLVEKHDENLKVNQGRNALLRAIALSLGEIEESLQTIKTMMARKL